MPDNRRPDWSGRLETLRRECARAGLDGFVVSTPLNIAYLTGFTGSAGLLLCSRTDQWLIADGRYELAVREAVEAGQLGPVRPERVEQRYDLTLAALAGRLGLRAVGVEAGHVTLAVLRAWQEASTNGGIEWRPTDGVVERQRVVKDAYEVAVLREAAHRLSGVARELGSWVGAGRTEREIARAIDAALERAGFSEPAFPTIVASGPNSAHPHARPTDRRLVAGDLVVLDFGGVFDGYCVDLTRMAAVGRLESRASALVEAVGDAQASALAAVRPGVMASDVDAAARGVLEARGLGAAFVHSTGHGLGLEVHEAPRLARAGSTAPEPLRAGMVCTVEPGAYVEGLGGVRLEDDVLVTAEGSERLTDAPRDLLVV